MKKPDKILSNQFLAQTSPRILLAEDDSEMRRLIAWFLRKKGYEVVECADGRRLLDQLGSYLQPGAHKMYDLIISDIRMPGASGMEVLEAASTVQDFPPMILITAFGDEQTHQQAKRLGASAFLDKPFELEELLKRILELVPQMVLTSRII